MSLSTDSTQPTPTSAQDEMFVPFVAHVRLVPDLGTGKRRTMIANLEKASLRAEQSIQDYIDQDLFSREINIATPIAHTIQFGNSSARLTIVGFVKQFYSGGRFNVAPTTDIQVIHSGTDQGEFTAVTEVNRGGSLSEAQNPVSQVDDEVASLRFDLTQALLFGAPGLPNFTAGDIVHIEYNGVKYGFKNKGMRSFPTL